MKGLLVKDFLLMRKSKYVILFMLFIGIVGGINDISFAAGYILMFLAILSLSTISYDEANHGLNTLFTLPISKMDYVKEKYLFSLIITGIGFVFVTILGYFSKSDFMETLAILSTALFLLAISLPFQLKEGNEKGRIVLFVVVFGCTFLFAFLNQFFSEFFESMEETLNALDPTMFSVGLLISSFILYIISMMISIRIYNKKIVVQLTANSVRL